MRFTRPSEVALSPILVRPVREQLEHDRVIRLLQAKYKRKYEVGLNTAAEQGAPVGTGNSAVYPDLVLSSPERGRKLLGLVEVDTSESVNNLEAMSQWASFARQRAPFYLYVPAGSIDTARRLCTDLQIPVAEIWTYHPVGDQMRFTLVYRGPQAAQPEPKSASAAAHAGANSDAREVDVVAGPARTSARGQSRTTPRTTTGARRSRRVGASPTVRRKPAEKPRARNAKAASSRGRVAKKTAPTRAARTQKRK
jgi:hypothetical protein